MEAYTKFMGKTVEDAVQEACIELGTTSDNLDYRVIVHETKGFRGFGAKQAVIEARKKMSDEDIFEEMMKEEKKASGRSEKKANRKPEKNNKSAYKEEKETAYAYRQFWFPEHRLYLSGQRDRASRPDH